MVDNRRYRDKLIYWYLVVVSLIFGISDRTINSIIHNYSVGSVLQVFLGLTLLTLVYQLYPHNLGD